MNALAVSRLILDSLFNLDECGLSKAAFPDLSVTLSQQIGAPGW